MMMMQDLPSCFMLDNIQQFATSLLCFYFFFLSGKSLMLCQMSPSSKCSRIWTAVPNWLHPYTAGLLWTCQIGRTVMEQYADARLYVLSALKTMCAWLDFQSDGMQEERKVLSDCTLWIHLMHYALKQQPSKAVSDELDFIIQCETFNLFTGLDLFFPAIDFDHHKLYCR